MPFPMLGDSERISDQNVHTYRAYVTFGVASVTSYKGKGFTLTRTGVGVYQVTMGINYQRFIAYPQATWSKAAGTAILVPAVTAEGTLGTTGVFSFTLVNPNTGTATEPATTEKMTLEWSLSMDNENNNTGG